MREAPAKIAAMPTSAAMRGSTPGPAAARPARARERAHGAADGEQRRERVPPEVPLPSAIDHDGNFIAHRNASAPSARWPPRMSTMLSQPTPMVFGANQPTMPTASPPIAGHHIQWIGSFSNASSMPYTMRVTATLTRPCPRRAAHSTATRRVRARPRRASRTPARRRASNRAYRRR